MSYIVTSKLTEPATEIREPAYELSETGRPGHKPSEPARWSSKWAKRRGKCISLTWPCLWTTQMDYLTWSPIWTTYNDYMKKEDIKKRKTAFFFFSDNLQGTKNNVGKIDSVGFLDKGIFTGADPRLKIWHGSNVSARTKLLRNGILTLTKYGQWEFDPAVLEIVKITGVYPTPLPPSHSPLPPTADNIAKNNMRFPSTTVLFTKRAFKSRIYFWQGQKKTLFFQLKNAMSCWLAEMAITGHNSQDKYLTLGQHPSVKISSRKACQVNFLPNPGA